MKRTNFLTPWSEHATRWKNKQLIGAESINMQSSSYYMFHAGKTNIYSNNNNSMTKLFTYFTYYKKALFYI